MDMTKRIDKNLLVLVTLYKLLKDKTSIHFEDVINEVFIDYPEHFSLKKYNYPNNELINKIVYCFLKPKGFLLILNKKIKLTKKGKDIGRKSFNAVNRKVPIDTISSNKFSPNYKKEWINLISSFFANEDTLKDIIYDIDVYKFFGLSSSSKKSDIVSSRSRVDDIMIYGKKNYPKDFKKINKTYIRLIDKLEEIYD